MGASVEPEGRAKAVAVLCRVEASSENSWVFGEDAKLQGKSTGEFTVEIDGAAAHAGDHPGALDLGALELNEDDGLARAEEIGHYADNFEIEPFDLIARENCVGVTLHAGTDLIEGKDLIRLGCGGDWEKQRG